MSTSLKATELRLGNWIQVADEYAQITCISGDGISAESETAAYTFEPFSEVFGIPITESLLLKCGFTLSHCNEYYKHYKLPNGIWISQWIGADQKNAYLLKHGDWVMQDNEVVIGSLHWLCNYIYFRYGGYELEVAL